MDTLKNVSSLQRKRLYEEVSNEIKKAIFSGDYEVGDKLPSETEMAKLFQVSRSVIREAIMYLELTGIVKVRQGATGGAFISEMNPQIIQTFIKDLLVSGKISFRQLADVREYLDPEIARLAAINASEEDLEELKQPVYTLLAETSKIEMLRSMARFHSLLGRASHNPFYVIINDCITELSTEITAEFTRIIKKEELQRIQSEHEGIYKAVSARDPEKAEELTRQHTEWMTKRMVDREKAYLRLIRKKP